MSLDNLSAIGKKEALMLTKEQIEMMLRINAPEVTLVQHIVRRPDLEKYWTYIRKINVNGHQTVWTQCTSKLQNNAFKGGEMSHYLNCSFLTMEGSRFDLHTVVNINKNLCNRTNSVTRFHFKRLKIEHYRDRNESTGMSRSTKGSLPNICHHATLETFPWLRKVLG